MSVRERIQHMVVLMLENRSFDHIFGFRQGVKGLAGNEFNLIDPQQGNAPGNKLMVGTPAPYSIDAKDGPSHSYAAVNVQLCNNNKGPQSETEIRNNGFAHNYALELKKENKATPDQIRVAMLSFTADQLPIINRLADEFCLCDNWFCDMPGPTMPNRMFMHAATAQGFVHNDWKYIFENDTIYDRFQSANLSWASYSFDSNEVMQFKQLLKYHTSFRLFEDSFAQDVANGQLPNYSFIVPRFFGKPGQPVNSEHAPRDIRPGETLIADVYAALTANPEVWNKTVFIITYDEHGGFYDHIRPTTKVPAPDSFTSPRTDDPAWVKPFDFTRIGLRVPAIIASPWIKKGRVDSRYFQNTSILATASKIFNLGEPLTRRDAEAPSFEDLFMELAEPRQDTPARLTDEQDIAGTEMDAASASDVDEGLDPLQKEILEGILARMSQLVPEEEMDAVNVPTTQSEAADFIKAAQGRMIEGNQ